MADLIVQLLNHLYVGRWLAVINITTGIVTVNLTNAVRFTEFVLQVRRERRNEIVLLPSYCHPLRSRQLESFAEVLRFYPEFAEDRRRWFDRVHIDAGDGKGLQQLSLYWRRGGPGWLRWAIWGLTLLGHHRLRSFFRAFEGKENLAKSYYTNVERQIGKQDADHQFFESKS